MTQTYNYYYSSFLLLCILIVVILLESCLPAKQEECMRKVNFNECDDERKTFFWQNFWLGRISRRFVSAKEMIAPHTTTTGEISIAVCLQFSAPF